MNVELRSNFSAAAAIEKCPLRRTLAIYGAISMKITERAAHTKEERGDSSPVNHEDWSGLCSLLHSYSTEWNCIAMNFFLCFTPSSTMRYWGNFSIISLTMIGWKGWKKTANEERWNENKRMNKSRWRFTWRTSLSGSKLHRFLLMEICGRFMTILCIDDWRWAINFKFIRKIIHSKWEQSRHGGKFCSRFFATTTTKRSFLRLQFINFLFCWLKRHTMTSLSKPQLGKNWAIMFWKKDFEEFP